MYYQQPLDSSFQGPYFNRPPVQPPFMPMPMEEPRINYEDKNAELIEQAANREKKILCYDEKIMDYFENELDKKRIRHISLNQRKHVKMFGEIYQGMTGRKLSFDIKEPNLKDDFKYNLEERIFQGFECIELYRKIYFLVIPVEWKFMMYEIISDEQNDILKYIYYSQKM